MDDIIINGGSWILIIFIMYKMIIFKFSFLRVRWNESFFGYIGRILLKIKPISKMYNKKIKDTYKSSIRKIRNQFSSIRTYTTIPKQGLSDREIYDLLSEYENFVLKKVVNKQISGTIYPNALNNSTGKNKKTGIYEYAFSVSYLWNSLHQDEFSIGNLIDYQIVQMVGSMFGAIPEEIMGFVTSGGTESLMCAVRCYRNYGLYEKGHSPGESIIIAPDTVHAAVIKAADAYILKIILIPTDVYGNVDMYELKYQAKRHSKSLVAIIGSAPSYCTGCIDPIAEMALIAKKYEAGFHVDCCLGGFIINYLNDYTVNYLALDGVTSLSADTHKNGQAPKGSSVLITKRIASCQKQLSEYSIYTVPNWKGGVYGTPKDAGSQSCVPSITTFVSLLSIGSDKYASIARSIRDKTIELSKIIESNDDFTLLNSTYINIMAFKMNPKKKFPKGTIYRLVHSMSESGVILNSMRDEIAHFCVTDRFACDTNSVFMFESALKTAIFYVTSRYISDVDSSTAGMYCSLECALNPIKSSGPKPFVENLFWGEMGAKDSIRQHFLALLNPNR